MDLVRIHGAVDDALSILTQQGSREEEFDLKVELALRTIREELQKLKAARKPRLS